MQILWPGKNGGKNKKYSLCPLIFSPQPSFLTEKMVFCIINIPGGAVAQLGEYVTGSHGVAGSSPVSSTIKFFFEQVPKTEVAWFSWLSESFQASLNINSYQDEPDPLKPGSEDSAKTQ